MAKKKVTASKTRHDKERDDGTEVYDETEDEQDEKEWMPEDEKKPEKVEHEQHAQMPENKPGEAPPDPKDQPAVTPNYDISPNNPVPPVKED